MDDNYWNSPDYLAWLELAKKDYDYSKITPLSFDFLFEKTVDKTQKED